MLSREKNNHEPVRRAAAAGLFYPESPSNLRQCVESCLNDVQISVVPGELIAVVVPHAGYMYSGRVAAHIYRLLQSVYFDTAVIVGPNHQGVGHYGTSVYAEGSFLTPLGLSQVDSDVAGDILEMDGEARFDPYSHAKEHSVEVQIPFLQVINPRAKIVPIVMSDYGRKVCERLAGALYRTIRKRKNKKLLLVASSDLSHYYKYDKAVALDRAAIRAIESLDPKRFYVEASEAETCELCGFGPVLTVLAAAQNQGADRATTLCYANSGDVTEDRSRVVGYAAVALMRAEEEESVNPASGKEAAVLSGHEQVLCELGRDSIRRYLSGDPPPEIPDGLKDLRSGGGVFVTLRTKGKLRGCVGTLSKAMPLAEAVRQTAIKSAAEDFRFDPLKPEEIRDTVIEISVLSEPVLMQTADQIRVGRHGLLVRDGARSGLLLPQVAVEQSWGHAEFLAHTCAKAGLPPDAWKNGAQVFLFTTTCFTGSVF